MNTRMLPNCDCGPERGLCALHDPRQHLAGVMTQDEQMEDASAIGQIDQMLTEAAYLMRDAIEGAEAGHRGLSVPIEETVNEILLPNGWKLVRAEKFTGFR